MFQRKIDEIFKELKNVFSTADDFLVLGYDNDGADHNEKVLEICRKENLKLNKQKCNFRCTSIYCFGGDHIKKLFQSIPT